jgi:hypothetical protein
MGVSALGGDVPAEHTLPGSQEPIRQGAAHEPEADQADRWTGHGG